MNSMRNILVVLIVSTLLVDTDGWMVKKFNQIKDLFNRKKESHLPMEEPRGKPGDSKSVTNAKHDPDDKLPKGHPPLKGKGSEYEEKDFEKLCDNCHV